MRWYKTVIVLKLETMVYMEYNTFIIRMTDYLLVLIRQYLQIIVRRKIKVQNRAYKKTNFRILGRMWDNNLFFLIYLHVERQKHMLLFIRSNNGMMITTLEMEVRE